MKPSSPLLSTRIKGGPFFSWPGWAGVGVITTLPLAVIGLLYSRRQVELAEQSAGKPIAKLDKRKLIIDPVQPKTTSSSITYSYALNLIKNKRYEEAKASYEELRKLENDSLDSVRGYALACSMIYDYQYQSHRVIDKRNLLDWQKSLEILLDKKHIILMNHPEVITTKQFKDAVNAKLKEANR